MLGAALALCAVGAAPGLASTDTPLTWATACASDLDVAGCERTTWIANKLDDNETSDRTELTAWGVWFLAGITATGLFANRWHGSFRFWRD